MSIYRFLSKASDHSLNIYGNNLTSLSDHQNVCLWSADNVGEQLWNIVPFGTGYFIKSIIVPTYGLNPYRVGTGNWNCDLFPVSGNETDATVNILFLGDYCKIQSASYTNKVLTAASVADGAEVYWADDTGSDLQLWEIFKKENALRFPLDTYENISRNYSQSHLGIDISAYRYTDIKAAQSGRVIYMQSWAGNNLNLDSMGNAVYIQHQYGMSIYMHLNECPTSYISLGQNVDIGDTIGRVGNTGYSTGPHLHFGYKYGLDFTYNCKNAYYEGVWKSPYEYFA